MPNEKNLARKKRAFGYGTLEGSGRKKCVRLTWIHFVVYVAELRQRDPRKSAHDPPSTAPSQRIDRRSMPFLTEFHSQL